jgi:hypothetical protein
MNWYRIFAVRARYQKLEGERISGEPSTKAAACFCYALIHDRRLHKKRTRV